MGLVELGDARTRSDLETIHRLITEHFQFTESAVAGRLLADWDRAQLEFVKIMPRDYRRVLAERAARSAGEQASAMELVHNG